MNVSLERRMHLLPTRHKFTTCSDYAITLLHSFVRPHCVGLLSSGLESPWLPPLPWSAVSRAHGRRHASAKGRRAPKTKGKLHPGMRAVSNRHYHWLHGFHCWWNRLWGGEQGENQHLLNAYHTPGTLTCMMALDWLKLEPLRSDNTLP